MKTVRVEDAVGSVLAHDLTRAVPGERKGAAFKKGHVVRTADIPLLKSMGKYHLNVLRMEPGLLHEEDAACRLAAAAAGANLRCTAPAEGRVNIKSTAHGLLTVHVPALSDINGIDDIILATLHNGTLVQPDTTVAAAKVVPLVIAEQSVAQAEAIARAHAPLLCVHPLLPLAAGIVVTGTEVYEGRIQDRFAPVLRQKVEALGGRVLNVTLAPDEHEQIENAIRAQLRAGAQLVLVSGGMAVDADDVTPTAIRTVAPDVVSYGSPVLPGAMFLLAYAGTAAVVGVPACGMMRRITVLDLMLPRLFAGIRVQKSDLTALAHGGLCLDCPECAWPVCPFGKG